MLPKKYRLSKQKEFERVFDSGKKQTNLIFTLFFLKNNVNYSRFAFLVGKRVSKKAVERNRLKRIQREAVRKNIKTIKPGVDYVFLAKKNAINIRKTAKIWEEMTKALKKQRLLNQ